MKNSLKGFGEKFLDVIIKPIILPLIDLFPKDTDIDISLPVAQ